MRIALNVEYMAQVLTTVNVNFTDSSTMTLNGQHLKNLSVLTQSFVQSENTLPIWS